MTTKHTGEECEICPPGTHIIDCTCPLKGRMGQCKDGECFHGAPKEEIENGFPENDLIELAQALSLPGGFNGFTAYKEALKKFDDELRRVIAVASSAPKEETGEEWLEDLWYHAHNWRTAATPEDMAIGVRAMENFIRSARTQAVDEYKKKLEEATKEDPFGDFLKTQGINVVDVTPAQKEEGRRVSGVDTMDGVTTTVSGLVDDKGILTIDSVTSQKEEWLEDLWYHAHNWRTAQTPEDIAKATRAFEQFVASQISQAEERGRIEGWERGAQTSAIENMDMAIGVSQWMNYGEKFGYAGYFRNKIRLSTITAFEEFAKDNESNNKGYGEDGYVTLTDLLSYASSLKSNAPKV